MNNCFLCCRHFVTQIIYFLEIESTEVNKKTITTVSDVTAAINFNITSGMNFTILTLEQIVSVVRASSTFTIALAAPVQSIHITQVQTGLSTAWHDVVSEANGVVIVMQDTAITVEG